MGCCVSEEDPIMKEIDSRLKKEQVKDGKERKLLLLGTGDSGKSTVFKSIKRIQGVPMLEPRTIRETCAMVRQGLIEFLIKLLFKSRQLYEQDSELHGDCRIDDQDTVIASHILLVAKYQETAFNDELNIAGEDLINLGKSIAYLWDLAPVQATFSKRGSRFFFPDNLEFFYKKATTVLHPEYVPTEEDVLRCRVRTTGSVNYTYTEQETTFVITDVGGQRSERKKWLSHFDSISGVIFVTALNHYTTMLFEDEQKNAMHEALQLFQDYANRQEFRQAEVILFLNKRDLFEEELRRAPLSVCFGPDASWEGEEWKGLNYQRIEGDEEEDRLHFQDCYSQAITFMKELFINRNATLNRIVFCHVTCATDQDNIKTVFWDVQNIIIRANMRSGGLIG